MPGIFPERVETDRLILTRPAPADMPELTAMHSDPAVMATLGGLKTPEELDAMNARLFGAWETRGFGWWVARRKTGEFVGRGGLKRVHIADSDEVEIGYGLVPHEWGKGLALEIANESLRVGFEILELESIVCFTQPWNLRSRRVMEKAGFVYERDAIYFDLPHVLYRIRRPL